MLQIRNFKDVSDMPISKPMDTAKDVLPKTTIIPSAAIQKRFKPCVGNDILKCAHKRNNVLTEDIYRKEGAFSLEDVTKYYGSFDNACTVLQIINPNNIKDYNMVLADIHNVRQFCGKIDADTYKENGAYPYDAVDKRYGFQFLLVKEKLAPSAVLYPHYQSKRKSGSSIFIRSLLTYNKHFYCF